MSDDNQNVKPRRPSVQAYVLSAICLLIGVAMGYLCQGSTARKPGSSAPPAAVQGQMPAAGPGAAAQPTPEEMKRMADKRVAPLLEQLKNNPNDTKTLAEVGQDYFVAKQFNDAATYFNKVVEIKPTAQAWTNVASAYYYGGAGEKAIEALNQALKIDPKFGNGLYNLGMLKWLVEGDTKGAIECWEKLLKTNPDASHRAQVEAMIARAKKHATEVADAAKTGKPAM
jgi:cytochrome c-type biogenesis protein CcmH/NrfG